MPQKDYKFQWQDWKKCICVCHIRIFEGVGDLAGKKIVIASDCGEGNSVTNEAENIATLICQKENIVPADLVFIEHYGKRGKTEETFDLVEFNHDTRRDILISPRWKAWNREKCEKAIGEKLPEIQETVLRETYGQSAATL